MSQYDDALYPEDGPKSVDLAQEAVNHFERAALYLSGAVLALTHEDIAMAEEADQGEFGDGESSKAATG